MFMLSPIFALIAKLTNLSAKQKNAFAALRQMNVKYKCIFSFFILTVFGYFILPDLSIRTDLLYIRPL